MPDGYYFVPADGVYDAHFDSDLDELAGGIAAGLTAWDTKSRDPVRYLGTPEPASLLIWGLLCLGSAGMGVRARRRMRRSA